jgi:hypothetical protein
MARFEMILIGPGHPDYGTPSPRTYVREKGTTEVYRLRLDGEFSLQGRVILPDEEDIPVSREQVSSLDWEG